MPCYDSYWNLFSEVNGSLSFLASFVSLMPQIIETYRDKTVEGISPYFLLCWLLGDITGTTGAVLTKQLTFQILLSIYFLSNDFLVCCQYYYYGILHKNKLATLSHESKPGLSVTELIDEDEDEDDVINMDASSILQRLRSRGSNRSNLIAASVVTLSSQISSTTAMPLIIKSHKDTQPFQPQIPIPGSDHLHNSFGAFMSWLGASFYVGARLPQLYRNYQRKSTDGISPFLFATTLFANITYNISIFTSCNFFDAEDKLEFIMNEMPFIFGSAGTILFDIIYFYQHYVLYSKDMKLRELERELFNENNTLIINGENDSIGNIGNTGANPSETSPLLSQ